MRYSLGQAGPAHRDEMAAVRAFSGRHPEVTTADEANNVAQSYLSDAFHEIAAGDCQLALADRDGAGRTLGGLPDRRHTESTLDRNLTKEDAASYQKQCAG